MGVPEPLKPGQGVVTTEFVRLTDGEIAQLAADAARDKGCDCEPLTVQIIHLSGNDVVQANIPHLEGCSWDVLQL